MLTLQQIKEVTFTKTMGGYKTNEVDDFIDQCVETVAGLIEERNTSNKKLEVLADKLMEYRNEEDSIRSALMSAQRLGDTIVREANQKASLVQEDAAIKAEKLLTDAQVKADGLVNSVADEVKAQEAELKRLKHEVAMFKERMLTIYKEHLSLIDLLPEEPKPEEPVAETAEVATEPEAAAQVEAPAEELKPVEATVAEETAEPEVTKQPAVAASAQPAFVPLVLEETEVEVIKPSSTEKAKSRFGDLKFGEDYVIAEDRDEEKGGKGLFKRKK